MSGKKISAPPRPPAPKVGLDKFRSKPTSAGTSLAIRFKSLEEDDDEELSVLDSNKNENVKSSASPITVSESRKLARFHATSKSLDEDRLYSPSHRVSDNKEEKRTLFSGIKDKLSDKFPDTIQAITKKWEELSGESSSPSPENEALDALNHANSTEVNHAKLERSTLSSSFSSPNIGQLPQSGVKIKGLDSIVVKEDRIDGETSSPAKPRVPSIAEEGKDSTRDDIEIVDDFYCEEAFEDFNGCLNSPSERSVPGTSVRQRSPIQRLIKNKSPSDSPSTPMSMSSLLMRNVAEETPESVEYDGNVFFDPNEESNKVKSDAPEISGSSAESDTSHPSDSIKDQGSKIPVQKLGLYTLALFVYFILPLPSFLSGMLVGVALTSIGWTTYLWLTKPPKPREPIKIEPLEDLPPMVVPEMKELRPDDGKYKGWMNELLYYDSNNYHINQTHSVFVRLDGSVLRLSRPKMGVPKRAMWDEGHVSPQFIHQRYLDLEGSRLFLLPPGLVEKRLWSKKYPLCIALAKPGNKGQSKHGSDSSNQWEDELLGGAAKEVSGFEVVSEQSCESSVLYLFARTNREKEEWYYRMLGATRGMPLPNHLLEVRKALEFKPKHRRSSSDQPTRHKRNISTDSTGSAPPEEVNNKDDAPCPTADIGTFAQYMARLMPADRPSKAASPTHLKRDSGSKDGKEAVKDYRTYAGSITCDPQLVWLNALLGRCFWDFLLQNYWKEKIQEKLEKKLSKIHVPYFMEELKVTDIDLGSEMPVIRRPSKPYLDERGFWVDLEVAYSGGFRMTIETKLNLMRLKDKSKPKVQVENKADKKRSAVTDEEEEDSAESSTDEEGEETPTTSGEDSATQGGTGKKLLKYLDKITQSKYFQSATEIKYIKKAMVGVSNTPLILTVELHSLVGTLAINIPPPPSDRLWYGFRGNPRLWLVAKPKVGEREVTVTHVTEWIEKKLAIEFQRVFVMPNMDDLVIPLMMSGMSADSMPPLPSHNSTEV